MGKFETAHFVIGGYEPETQPQKGLAEIVKEVRYRLADILEDPNGGLAGTHPRVVISMVITNILVNLLYHSIGRAEPKVRLSMVQDTLDEIHDLSLNLWKTLEAANADEKTAH